MKTESVDANTVMLPITIAWMLKFSNLTDAPIILSEQADPRQYSSGMQKCRKTFPPYIWICFSNGGSHTVVCTVHLRCKNLLRFQPGFSQA